MSWLDSIVRAVERRRIPWWLIFMVSFLGMAIVLSASKWLDGSRSFPELDRLILDSFYGSAALAAYGLITTAAGRALDRILPALEDTDEQTSRSRRRLTTLPQWQLVVVFVVGAGFGVLTIVTEPLIADQVFTSIPSAIVTLLFGFVIGYGLAMVVVWQLLRIVAEVISLHGRITVIDIERSGPAHAFAPVTAGAGAFLLAVATYSALTDPATFTSTSLFILFCVVTLVAALVFVVPLLGMRARLVEAKHIELDAIAVRMRCVLNDFEGAVDSRMYGTVGDIRGTIDALVERRERVRRLSTWPWDAHVATGFAGALALPLLIWALTTFAERLFGL